MRVEQFSMRTSVHLILVCGVLGSAAAAEPDAQDIGRDVGAVLAWRLSPELVEETCRDVDPAGIEARALALRSWQDKNAALIKAVDERIGEVVSLAYPSPNPEEAVTAVRAKVKQMLLETVSAEGDAEQLKAACQKDANPVSPRWSLYRLPDVQNSLAALYDWKVQKEKK
jgi:hypothetical protein